MAILQYCLHFSFFNKSLYKLRNYLHLYLIICYIHHLIVKLRIKVRVLFIVKRLTKYYIDNS